MYHYAAAPVYAPPSTYHSYDDGYHEDGYHRRTADEGRNLDSPSTFQYLSKMVTNAIEKYSAIDQEEEYGTEAKGS